MRVLALADLPSEGTHVEGIFIQRQIESLRRLGVQVDVMPIGGKKNSLNYVRLIGRLLHRKIPRGFDLVHAHYGLTGFFARFQRKLPLVVTYRGSDVFGIVGSNFQYTLKGRIIVMLSLRAARWADGVIAVSRKISERIPARVPVHIIPSGVDLDRFRPLSRQETREILGLPGEDRLVLFAANPREPRKRFDLAQDAVNRLRGQGLDDVKLIFPYPVPPDRMPLYMNACNVLLLTSLHEGSPNVVKEALACNLPVVSTAVGDVPELLAGLEGCFLCGFSAEEIAAKLRLALETGVLSGGRAKMEQISTSKTAEQVLEVYRETLQRWEKRRRAAS